MHLRAEAWRFSLFAALGFCPNACGGATEQSTPHGKTEPQDQPLGVSKCGQSSAFPLEQPVADLAKCESGLVHRPSGDVECWSYVPRPDSELPATLTSAEGSECDSDDDCTAQPYGFCAAWGSPGGPPTAATCRYGCVTDSDCPSGTLCECGGPVGQCVTSNCRQDADCGDDLLCARWDSATNASCGSSFSYQCQKPNDDCAVDADCPAGEYGGRCISQGESHVCILEDGWVCGRPFLVAGAARVATLTTRAFGAAEVGFTHGAHAMAFDPTVLSNALSRDLRESIGAHWANIGLMEHASIAAFARFALQLMHVGAPLELLEAAQRAMIDETEHTKACFGVASWLLGRPVGPGKLDLHDALTDTALADIVRLTVREGCIGETIAAMEAAESATTTTVGGIQRVLLQIQSDELRHAELAWRFVQWALTQKGHRSSPDVDEPSLRDVVAEEFARALAECDAPGVGEPATSPAEDLTSRFGVLPERTRRELRTTALRDVITPCAAQLLRRADQVAEIAKRDVQLVSSESGKRNSLSSGDC